MSLALNVVELILGVVGTIGVVTFMQSMVRWALPEQRLKILEETLVSARELLEESLEDGLPFPNDWLEATERDFST